MIYIIFILTLLFYFYILNASIDTYAHGVIVKVTTNRCYIVNQADGRILKCRSMYNLKVGDQATAVYKWFNWYIL